MDTGRQIIEEAIRQFQDMGLRFTMQDVAQALHISKKTIYSAFASKEDLLIAMLDAGFEEIHKDKRAILESDMDLCDKIRTAMIAMPDQYQVIDFRMLSELNEKYPKAYACLVSHLENNWEPVTALLEEGMKQRRIRRVSIPILKQMFTASIESFVSTDQLTRDGISYGDALRELMDIIMHGITEAGHAKNQ